MTNHTEIPEELEEMIKEIVAYEELNEEDLDRERMEEWAREWLYIDPPTLQINIEPNTIKDVDEEDIWKIEIKL